MRSRKPEAKEFQRWVTHEVLPSIRKHGAYMTQQTLDKALTSPDFLIQLATKLKEEKDGLKTSTLYEVPESKLAAFIQWASDMHGQSR